MHKRERVLIIGAGQAAAQAIDTLRRGRFEGGIVLVGDEPSWPYMRPPLSKKYLAGAVARERLLIRPAHFFEERQVEAHLGRRACEVDRKAQRVRLDDGSVHAYDALLLATGSRPRALIAPGADLQGVHFLRTLADVERIMSDLQRRRRLVIVGGGYIGLEVAATCAGLGIDVTVLEMADRVMSRVTCAAVSDFFALEHARRGVRLVCNTRVYALSAQAGTGRVGSVICEDGAEYPADLVVVGVGVTPAEEIAAAAGLECGNGIVVDECGRTADPSIYAAGDCANQPSLRYGRRLRLESINNAFEQGESAALAILGAPVARDNVPWFWSEQFDLKLVIVGLGHEYDAIVMRGSPATRSFSACYLRGGELVAIDTVGSPRDQLAARKLIAARVRPNLERLADANIALKDCA